MLLTPEYKALLQKMRQAQPEWGSRCAKHLKPVLALAEHRQADSVLDYGCGAGRLVDALRIALPGAAISGYDPSRSDCLEALPADLLVSTDVLEHVEPECLEAVLEHMAGLAPAAYINIHFWFAKAILPDGRNAHLIVKPSHWWAAQLRRHWSIVRRVEDTGVFVCE